MSTSIPGDSVREICWCGPNPEAGKSKEVPEVELTRLRMVLSMKTTGYLRENLLWSNVCEARSPLSQWSALWYDE